MHYFKCLVARIDLECELTIKGLYKSKQEESDQLINPRTY